MKKLVLLSIIAALVPEPAMAACHRYHYWAFHFPQRCGVARHLTFARVRQAFARPHRPTSAPAIALPGLASADCDGGEADEATRGRLLLRAALEVVHDR